jgi:gamma-glutamyltranspeptidase/glutathione hydrolase
MTLISSYSNIQTTVFRTLRAIVKKGKNGFYKGHVANAIVNIIKEKGGLLTRDDLKTHQSELVEPLSIDYADVTVWECPPNGQGITALVALGILQELQDIKIIKPLNEIEVNSADWIHALAEALKIAFADSRQYVADPVNNHNSFKNLVDEVGHILLDLLLL